jgi:CubicO group peptidase (beta-lactamase class C family)
MDSTALVMGCRQVTKRLVKFSVASLAITAFTLFLIFRPDLAARSATGLTAHNLCSAIFVSGLDADATFRELVRPMIGAGVASLIRYRVDTSGNMVTASLVGAFNSTARATPGYGCRLEFSDNLPISARELQPAVPASGGFAPSTPVLAASSAIAAAIDRVFAERADQPIKDVKAVVVVKNGEVIAERYAPGFGVETPLLGYSVSKSFTNALLGVLVREGRLNTSQAVGAPEWSTKGDPRSAITIENLLRMESGIDAAETGTGFDPVTRMELTQSDMAAFAARHGLKQAPGTAWEYTSANTLILDRLLGNIVGGGAAGMRDFAERELFLPMQMRGVTMEFDGAGDFVGSSYVYAPARSYARLGILYLKDGIAPNGERILPAGWVAWSAQSRLGAPYGAGFWTNDGLSPDARWRIAHGFPKDGFFASGNLGQRIYIVPSKGLVVARFGYSRPPNFGIEDDVALIDAVIRDEVKSSAQRSIPGN